MSTCSPDSTTCARGRRLIYYDQRGGGRSPVPRSVPVGWTEQVADLEALREHFGLARITLVGYSWGGLLAELYALEHRDRVERLALVSPAPAWRAAREEFEHTFSEAQSRSRLSGRAQEVAGERPPGARPRSVPQRMFELSVAPYFFDPARARELTPFRVTGRTQQEVWSSLGEYDLRPRLPELNGIPALVMHGENDAIPL